MNNQPFIKNRKFYLGVVLTIIEGLLAGCNFFPLYIVMQMLWQNNVNMTNLLQITGSLALIYLLRLIIYGTGYTFSQIGGAEVSFKLRLYLGNKIKNIPAHIHQEFERAIALRVIDTHWMEHINTMSVLREGIHLRGYAQEDPLRAYTTEGYELFDNLLDVIDKEVVTFLMKAEVRQNTERKEVVKGNAAEDNSKVKKQTPKKAEKIGRNEPCPCGSGKKYKQCCGK